MSSSLEIAIIGMAGRFPGAANVAALWRNLCAGEESIARPSEPELRAAGVPAEMLARPDYVRASAPLADADQFDAAFFGYSEQAAAQLDPQHRQFLECAFETFESAGLDPARLDSRVAVYAGSSLNGYLFHVLPRTGRVESAQDMAALLALDKDFLATRVSYKLDLRGPSVAVQTACSTSLVAVHLACQSLLLGECELALAGGVSISVPQQVGYLHQPGGIASPDGHCRAFDAAAQGTVAGSGVGVVLLKRLDDALADGDPIVAVIKGSAINNDGRGKAGFTAPSVAGQARAVRDAHEAAGVTADSIVYLEAHGTGTPLGDPIEVAALTRAFRTSSERTQYCALGSLKTNLGHLDAAAGVAGLIKAALVLKHRRVPASLHYRAANPAIDFASSPFFVAAQACELRGAHPLRAGVSSFGIGGTNAHVVLEEAPVAALSPERFPAVLHLSARSPEKLVMLREAVADELERSPLRVTDLAHTLAHGRRAFAQRWARRVDSRAEAIALLRAGGEAVNAREGRPVAFLFPGQGSQQVAAGRALYERDDVFREQLDRCASWLDFDLRALLFPAPGQLRAAQAQLDDTAYTQPATFALSYALARTMIALGVAPCALLGHSVGEYVAACLAGTLTLPDAIGLVSLRGKLMQRAPEGAMLAVAAAPERLAAFLDESVELAAINAPARCVIAGRDVDVLAQR
ncbi:MAG TPA: type I polyketide synthase, partial [Polyangiales bacterium]|nr:type I polyketide synthase [Polyangiales bacterium]